LLFRDEPHHVRQLTDIAAFVAEARLPAPRQS